MLTDDDTPPDCVQGLVVRRLLWQEYGIAIPDMTLTEILLAVRWNNAEVRRHNELQRRANRQQG